MKVKTGDKPNRFIFNFENSEYDTLKQKADLKGQTVEDYIKNCINEAVEKGLKEIEKLSSAN